MIRRERPDVVTLNEVCRKDVATLARALSAARGNQPVAAAFKAARDRPTGGPFRCVNGQPYGIGVLALLDRPTPRYRTYAGVYPQQDLADPEERVWVCIDLPTGLLACTTHTASTSRTVALAQCRYFLNTAVPKVRSQVGDLPVTLGADLNLRAHGTPSPQSCLPRGYQRADDGLLQDVIASSDIARAIAHRHRHARCDRSPGAARRRSLSSVPFALRLVEGDVDVLETLGPLRFRQTRVGAASAVVSSTSSVNGVSSERG